MKPKINIKFDQNEYGVYYSGQVVSGKVEITFSKTKKVRGIAINITGSARTQWKGKYTAWVGEGEKKKTQKSQFTGKEDYLTSTSYLVGSEVATPVEILPGIHTYNFACAIPSYAPSSFEGAHGHIRYVVKIILERPWKYNQTYTVGFTVLKPLDLNYDSPLLRIPSEVEAVKKFWCGVCYTSPLILRVKIPQTGFVPGQLIPLRTDITNGSNVTVSQVTFSLRKLILYRSDTPQPDYKEEIIDLVYNTSSDTSLKGTINFEQALLVPAVPPTSQFQSKIIQINYDVRVEVIIAGHKNVFVTCPVTIGTVPLYNSSHQPLGFQDDLNNEPAQSQSAPASSYFQNVDLSSSQAPMSLPVIAPVYNRAPSSPNCNIPPPTYEESIVLMRAQVDEGEEHSLQRTEYVPRYPVYSFPGPSAPQEFEIAQDIFEGKYPN